MLIDGRTIDALADELRQLTRLDVERLFSRMGDKEARSLFEIAFDDDLCELAQLRDELEHIEESHGSEIGRLEDKIDDLKDEIQDLKDDLRSIECDRDLLQGRIHCLTGETFDD